MSVGTLTARLNTDRLMPWLGGLAALLMLALLAWLGANIFWTLNAPESIRPSAPIDTDLQRTLPALVDRHLFGVFQEAAPATSAPSTFRLNGVIAPQQTGHRAYALVAIEGKPAQLVREGEEIVPGVTLRRVLSRHVEIQRGGQTQILSLPETPKAQSEATKTVPAAIPPAPEIARPIVNPPSSRKSRRNSQDDS